MKKILGYTISVLMIISMAYGAILLWGSDIQESLIQGIKALGVVFFILLLSIIASKLIYDN